MKWMQIKFHREFFMLVHHSDETILHLLFLEKMKSLLKMLFIFCPTRLDELIRTP